MKNQKEVHARLQTLILAEFDRRLGEATKRLPHLCRHNHRQVLDARKHVAGDVNDGYNRVERHSLPVIPSIGLCLYGHTDPANWAGNICEDPTDAQTCDLFDPRLDKEAIWHVFRLDLANPDWLRISLPEVYALLWVLDEAAPNHHLPWWKRLWFRFWGLRVEPVRRKIDGGRWADSYLMGGDSDDVFHGS